MRGSLKNNKTVKRSTENQTQRGKKQKNGDLKPIKNGANPKSLMSRKKK